MTRWTIITGTSTGLGEAMAELLLRGGVHVLGVARRTSDRLTQVASEPGSGHLEQWTVDLVEAQAVAMRVSHWLEHLPVTGLQRIDLINNAASIPTVAPLSDVPAAELARTLRVGLEAPLMLTAAFIKATETWSIPKRVLNISSGLGRRPMASQAAYCAIKAGLDHATRCIALDEGAKTYGVRISSMAPGVIETGMQSWLRAADPALFPDQPNFVTLHTSGSLTAPLEAAQQVLARLDRADFGTDPVSDVRR